MSFRCHAVVAGVCSAGFLLLGLFRTTQWVQKLCRQNARRVNRALKARGCQPHYTAPSASALLSSTPSMSLLSIWVSAVIIVISALFWLGHPLSPMPPDANFPQAFHYPSTALNLPPSHQPAHSQWFDPAKRDHVHWLEQCGYVVSSTFKASRDLWTLTLPTIPDSNKQQLHPTSSRHYSALGHAQCHMS